MADRSLARRWQGEEGSRLAAAVLDRLLAGRSLDDLPLDRSEGVIDVRGLVRPDPEVLGVGELAAEAEGGVTAGLRMQWLGDVLQFRDVTLADLDFSSAKLDDLRFFDVTLSRCRFDKAKCRDWRGWNLTVEGCGFVGADLRDSAIGTWYEGRGNRYRNVRFNKADLRDLSFQGTSFVDCDFTGAKLDQVRFAGCEFVRCRFGGQLNEVVFSATTRSDIDKSAPGFFEDVDLSMAVLRWVEFRGLSLDRVTLPEEGKEHVIVRHYPCVVRNALTRLEGGFDPETRRLRSRLRTEASQLDDGRNIGIWHRDELGETEDQQRFAREMLHEIERECTES